jgi:hypothetical protein
MTGSSKVSAILEHICARREEIARGIHKHILAAVPDPVSDMDPAHQERLRATIAQLLDYSLDAISASGHSYPPVPYLAKAEARRAARSGVSLGLVMRRYIAAHSRLGDYVLDEATRVGLASDAPTMHDLRRIQETLLEHLTATVEQAYNGEGQQIGRTPTQRRAVTVRRLLNEEPATTEELIALRYEINHNWHVGVVAEGEKPGQTIGTVRAGLGCELLEIAAGADLVWAWFGSERTIPARRLGAQLSKQCHLRLTFGEPRRGLDGFRRTHAEALAAQLVVRNRAMSMIHCADVTLDAALLANPLLFRLHQETYLTPLDGLRNKGQIARATLSAYFACEQNIVSTSHRLNVSRKTVENRLQQITAVLKLPLHACIPELQVALRLENLNAADRAPPDVVADKATHVDSQ